MPELTQNGPRGHAQHVLVCLDGSANSEISLPHALGIARIFRSDLTLVHVIPTDYPLAETYTSDVLDWEIARTEASAYLDRIQNQASAALARPVQARLEQGRPADRIVALARELSADLIVISSHGKGNDTPASLGSTAQQVLAMARGSVFVIHARKAGGDGPKRLLVPLDGSLRTESVLPTAARFAAAYGAELLLVHVVQDPVPTLILQAPEDVALACELAARLELAGQRYLASLRSRLGHEGAAIRTLVIRHPNERQALLELSNVEQVDVIVLSAHGSACDPVHSFGSVTTDLLTHSQLPMLVLQDLPDQEPNREHHRSDAPLLRASFPPEAE